MSKVFISKYLRSVKIFVYKVPHCENYGFAGKCKTRIEVCESTTTLAYSSRQVKRFLAHSLGTML
jgi:hypothetical protein